MSKELTHEFSDGRSLHLCGELSKEEEKPFQVVIIRYLDSKYTTYIFDVEEYFKDYVTAKEFYLKIKEGLD